MVYGKRYKNIIIYNIINKSLNYFIINLAKKVNKSQITFRIMFLHLLDTFWNNFAFNLE